MGGVRARAAGAAPPPSGADTPRDAWSDPARIAARRVPHPGGASWTRTYWPS
ncbi:acyl-CoA carboxylase subunit epsilon [Streptomyces sp. NPDC001027]|uniref:acyl-CoA carboxylase subunit epsilon n=1 Tax=Streptomyces sp. NPDC001027 TaxID=3154771 RepID=UPI0033284AD0